MYFFPALSFTTTVFLPWKSRPVMILFRPGPIRWNMWADDLSVTVIAYVPALIFFTGLPVTVFSEMTKSGPTEPLSGIGFGAATDEAAARRAATATTAGKRR